VEKFVMQHFIPVKVHMKEQPQTFERFGVQWTPVLAVFDEQGREQHRWEGFLPADDFVGQLAMGRAQLAFAKQDWKRAASLFDEVPKRHPDAEFAPAALYWAGVARYKDGDPSALAATGRALRDRYPQSTWATKASVWLPAEQEGARS
jgi:hypothetical protein